MKGEILIPKKSLITLRLSRQERNQKENYRKIMRSYTISSYEISLLVGIRNQNGP